MVRVHLEWIRSDLEDCVTQTEFEPIKRVVYGMTTLVLTAFVTALLGLVAWYGSQGLHR
jgi:hypothetical protein